MDDDQKLEQALTALEGLEDSFKEALIDDAEAEVKYRVEYAKEYLSANGTIQSREATAIKKVEKFLRERNNKRAIKEFMKEKVKDAQAVVSARQSLLTASRRTNERL